MSADDDERPSVSTDHNREPSDRSHRPQIDVERLAEKVYQLMLAEARMARSRHEL